MFFLIQGLFYSMRSITILLLALTAFASADHLKELADEKLNSLLTLRVDLAETAKYVADTMKRIGAITSVDQAGSYLISQYEFALFALVRDDVHKAIQEGHFTEKTLTDKFDEANAKFAKDIQLIKEMGQKDSQSRQQLDQFVTEEITKKPGSILIQGVPQTIPRKADSSTGVADHIRLILDKYLGL